VLNRRRLFLFFAAFLFTAFALRLGYVCARLEKQAAEETKPSPSVFYGRPLEIHPGDHLGNLRFAERLSRLNYKKVRATPRQAGAFSEANNAIRIFPRKPQAQAISKNEGWALLTLQNGRVREIRSSTGKPLDSILLEPQEIGRLSDEPPHLVSLNDVSPFLRQAVVASQDPRFYFHVGFDLPFIGCGATLTQQLAADYFLPRNVFARQLRIAELTIAMELLYSKNRILEMYLNQAYFGQAGSQRIYGVENASRFYFGKPAKNLSLEDAALLAGIFQSPHRRFPMRNLQEARDARNLVLARMRRRSMISEKEFLRASKASVVIQSRRGPADAGSYFLDYIQRITAEELGTEKFYHPGYRYDTSLDPVCQSIAEEAVAQGLEALAGSARPAGEPLQAALVAVDAKTGELVAMVGGRNYQQTRFNRAVDAKRQPGSAFKPFVLLAALSEGMTLSTRVSGGPITLPTPEGPWSPTNFEDKTYGEITIRKMIEESVNTATTRLAHDIGYEKVLHAARLAGITSPLRPVPSLALGSFEVRPMELAYAYATIASGGVRYERFPLRGVARANGDLLMTRQLERKRVFDPRVAHLAAYAMMGVLERGTAGESKSLGIYFPASGKTGTTNDNKDSWFAGFTPDIVCVVWVGYDSGADTGLTGAEGALRIWARFMRAFYSQSGPLPGPVPEGMEEAVIDRDTGYLATDQCPRKFKEFYIKGTAPRKTCPEHPAKPLQKKTSGKKRESG
jgi:penicillin-binding protein 1B